MTIAEYGLLSGRNSYDLVDVVNEYIKQGWQPYGYMQIDQGQYLQNIVKYRSETVLTESQWKNKIMEQQND